jgi:hypothetical protein
MRQLLALLFIIIIGVQTVHQGLIYTYFTLNKDYIVQNLCENKATPELKCNGKCHLKEFLSIATKEKKSEQAPIPNLEEIKVPILFFQTLEQSFIKKTIFKGIATQSKAIFQYFFWYSHQAISTILHPPQA